MVEKRDGRLVQFDPEKIKSAVLKAFMAVDKTISPYAMDKAENIAKKVEEIYKEKQLMGVNITVEETQDLVEHGLMSCKRKDVARAYITYRNNRTYKRERNTQLRQVIKEKLSASNVLNQNANLDEYSFGGRIGEAASAMTKQIALDEMVSETARYNHINNIVYLHDLDHYVLGDHNCLSVPFDQLLEDGFVARQCDIRSTKSIDTAFQLLAVIFQIQSLQQFGGVSATHLDWTLVPYYRISFWKHYKDGIEWVEQSDIIKSILEEMLVNKNLAKLPIDDYQHCFNAWDYANTDENTFTHDEWVIIKKSRAYKYAWKMTEKDCQQASEGMYHNLNTLQSRSGNQLPFTSINFGTCTLPEGRLIIRALLEGCIRGVGKFHRTAIFPCGIFQLGKGINRKPEDPNYDLFRLALKSTAKRIYPNYANIDWTGNKGYDKENPMTYFSTMGCRTANGWDINGLGQQKDGRGNICPVTLILPTIAMRAQETVMDSTEDSTEDNIIDTFMMMLCEYIDDAKDALIDRFEWICAQDPRSARFMYENNTMAGYDGKNIKSALKHGTLAIGQLGLAECLQILVGCDHTEPKGMALAKQIEQLFKDRCAAFKELYKLNFGVYYTPAENLCYTAMNKFKDTYGVIPNVSDKKYFTNSMHVPVWKKMSAFDKIDIESQLTPYSSAGCITYVELDSGVVNNIDALETIVNYAMDKDIPYFALNTCPDTCLNCGYTAEMNDCCPQCGSKNIQRLRRVTGYLTGNYTEAFNLGKQQEVEQRVKHTGIEYEIR